MLVYANHLRFQGPGAADLAFKAVGAWLKEQLGKGLHPKQLLKDGEFAGTRAGVPVWLRISTTVELKPELYSWVLKLPDENARGRQWIVEVGLKHSAGGLVDLSCVLKTDEYSTIVASPVAASRPRLIRYVVNNILRTSGVDFADATPGIYLRNVGADRDSYRALLVEIERRNREGPLVLVSPDKEGKYLIEPDYLQQTLIGLAQVVVVSPDFNSYEMAEVLGQSRSAWGGAVNILYMPTQEGFVRNRLFLADSIVEWGDQQARVAQILAWVTSNTNIPRFRKHIRPEGVVQLSLRRRTEAAVANSYQMTEAELRQTLEDTSRRVVEQENLFEKFAEENSQLEATIEGLRDDLEEANEDIAKKNYVVQVLQSQLDRAGDDRSFPLEIDRVVRLVTRNEPPSPTECLEIIERLYPDRCVVLATARKSAQAVERFARGRDLLDLLNRLVTQYRDRLAESGDSAARKVFGKDEYAAKESETVMKNQIMRRERTFEYNGRLLEMFRHVKIGIRDDASKTIRVHFHWDSERKKIVVGYCGEHLTLSGR